MRPMTRAASSAALVIAVLCAGCRTAGRGSERDTYADRAEESLASGDLTGARQGFERMLKADPRDAEARVGLARVALAAGDALSALAEAARAERECALTPAHALDIRIVRGRACQKLGHPPATVWAYLYPAYRGGSAATKASLRAELQRLAERVPPDTPGVREFTAETREGATVARQQRVHSRREWDGRSPSGASVPMGKPYRITIHHSAHNAVKTAYAARSAAAAAEIIRGMRNYQVDTKHWEDIAYHFVIDPRGEVWEGRPLRYQGAHTLGHNEGNIGICFIGNYERQKPTPTQIGNLTSLVGYLRKKYGIPKTAIFGHEELKPTDCPGKNLARVVAQLRK